MGKLSQQTGVLNEAGQLRSLIDSGERALVSLGSNPAQETARELMLNTHEAHRKLAALQDAGADMRAEEARLAGLDERIIREAPRVVQALGGREALVVLRQQTVQGISGSATGVERFWLLDEELDRRRRNLLKRLGITALVILVVLAVGYIARPILFPPDPAGDAITAANRALATNDLPGALAAIDAGLTIVPTDTELLIWKGFLLERNGDAQAAQAAYDQGLANAESDRAFYLERAITFARMGEYQRVITDTNTVLQKYPDSAEAYYLRATGYEGIGDTLQALADLEKCASLAQAQGNDQLFAQARVRTGQLMQAGAGQ